VSGKKPYRSLLLLATAALLPLSAAPPLFAADANLPVETRLERLERRIARLTDLMLQLETLKRENSELRGQIEVQKHAIESLKQRQRDLYIDIDQRLTQLQQSPAGTPARAPLAPPPAPVTTTQPAAAPAVAAVKPTVQVETTSEQEQADYQAAFALLSPSQRRYADAITALSAFLKQYPNSKLADNAQYWLAEANYVSQKNDAALQEFQKVVDLYPNSPKVAGALLKIGYLQHASGQTDQAKQTLQSVVQRFSNSAAANMAQKRLQRIKQESR
jgi:tol-pal system protein YbgF